LGSYQNRDKPLWLHTWYISLIFKGVLPKQPCCFEIDNDKGLKEPLETKEPLINKTLHFHLNSYYGLVEEQWVVWA
jgi:hypothetical protein